MAENISIEQIAEAAEAGDLEGALKLALPLLDDDFDDSAALFMVGFIFIKSEKYGLAYNILKRALELTPDNAGVWANMGKCFHATQQLDRGEKCFRQALRLKDGYAIALNNLALINLNRGEFKKGIEFANLAIVAEDHEDARINRAMCNMATGTWDWENYNLNIGKIKDRKELQYKDEPRWDGKPGQTVVVYGEQGIGDEINFASCIPDLQRDCEVIIDCDRRLEGLFKRSFNCPTYGTRYKQAHTWAEKEKIEAHVAVGALPQFYRKKDEDFPGTAYLKPNPVMQLQWRALLDSLGPRMKVGIAWNAGRKHTYSSVRSIPLETLSPLFELDCDWISLEYQTPQGHEKYGIHHWPWGVEAYDYDQTAALVSELDLVISVTTAVHHLTGALGKECWVLVPKQAMWQQNREVFHWAKSVQLFKQKGSWPIQELVEKLSSRLLTKKAITVTAESS